MPPLDTPVPLTAVAAPRPRVADIRPRADPELDLRPRGAAGRARPRAAAVHRPGRHHGDRGRPGAGQEHGTPPGRRTIDWDTALSAYNDVRTQHTARVQTTSRESGVLWHHVGVKREQRNAIRRTRDVYDHSFVDWLYGPTALVPEDEAPMLTPIPLSTAMQAAEPR